MISLVNPEVTSRIEDLAREFSSAQPFRHVVIDHFLDPGFCEELISQFPPFAVGDARNEHSELAGKSVNPAIAKLGAAYQRFDGLMRNSEFLELMGKITGIPALLYDADYIGGGTHENRNGQELDSHVDFNFHPKRFWHRRLNLIVFLNPEWKRGWGGCLELMRDPLADNDSDCKVVVPSANRAVIFETTESSWHGFPVIRTPEGSGITRKSLAVYFYTKDRPASEIAASHGTFYYQRPLPRHIQAGYKLRDEDIAEIRKLFSRRDDQIRFLYEREQEFSDVMQGIRTWSAFRIAQALTWPARALKRAIRR